MKADVIHNLFVSHGNTDADGNRLLECVLLIRGAAQAIQGVLSRHISKEDGEAGFRGSLKMLSKVGAVTHGLDRIDRFVEQFFDYEDVALIGVQREVVVKSAGSSILMG